MKRGHPESILKTWISLNLMTENALSLSLDRWGIDKKTLMGFLAGKTEIPLDALSQISFDTSIELADLLRDFGTSALLKTPEPKLAVAPSMARVVHYRVAKQAERFYEQTITDNRALLRAREELVIPAFGVTTISTGIRFLDKVVLEFHQNLDVFPADSFILRLRRGNGRPGYETVDAVQIIAGPAKHIKEGTKLGYVEIGFPERARRRNG